MAQAQKRPKAPAVKLEITEELIADAIPRDSSHCLWAEAVKAAYPDAQRIAVDIQTIRFTDPKKALRYTYLTPRTAQIALVQFDQGIRPEPHSVQLRRGQVTRSAQKTPERIPSVSLRSLDRAAQQKAAAKKGRDVLAKTTLRKHDDTSVPDRVGGKTPPIAAGKRRAFGLRGLDY